MDTSETNVIVSSVKLVAPFLMIFGGIAPFIPQYLLIYKNKHCDGFSTFVCLNLLISNILRICFWYGRPFELPLLFQSIVMITTMLILIRLCVKVTVPDLTKDEKHTVWDFDFRYFWRWSDFNSYVLFLLTFALFALVVTRLLLSYPTAINTIGFVSLFLESMLGAPQFYRNWKKKSTMGMSVSMVAMWTTGDIFKTVYFILRKAPEQFIVCGSMQVSLDVLIFLQYLFYNKFRRLSFSVKWSVFCAQELSALCTVFGLLSFFMKYNDGYWLSSFWWFLIGPFSPHILCCGEFRSCVTSLLILINFWDDSAIDISGSEYICTITV